MADELIYKPRLDPRASKFLSSSDDRESIVLASLRWKISRGARGSSSIRGNGSAGALSVVAWRGSSPISSCWMLTRGIDGAVNGSGAEIINHSCEPNLEAHILAGRRIYYVSQRAIRAGEELTVDYSFDTNQDPQECHCGARACRGDMRRPLNSREGRSERCLRTMTQETLLFDRRPMRLF